MRESNIENLNSYAKTMAKWMSEWTEMIDNIDDKIAAAGQGYWKPQWRPYYYGPYMKVSLNHFQGGLDENCRVKIEEFAALQVTFKKLNKFIPPENSTAPISDETQAGLQHNSVWFVL